MASRKAVAPVAMAKTATLKKTAPATKPAAAKKAEDKTNLSILAK